MKKIIVYAFFAAAAGCASTQQSFDGVHFLRDDPQICQGLQKHNMGNGGAVADCLRKFGKYAAQALLMDQRTSEHYKMYVVYHYDQLALPQIEEFKSQNPNALNAEELWRAGFVEQVSVIHPDWTRGFMRKKLAEFEEFSAAPPGCTAVAPQEYTCT